MDDLTEQQLGRYQITRLLERNAFADLYFAVHVDYRMQALLKVLRTMALQEDAEAFLNEMQAIGGLVHPNIARIFDVGVQDKVPYLVMEYARNGSLRRFYRRGYTHTPESILAHVKQISSALAFAHSMHIMHGDIKPENMLLGRQQEALLSDFGLTLMAQRLHLSDVAGMMGAVTYMAPEQLRGEASFASDQYALGIVMYEWLTGAPPFGGTFYDVGRQQMFLAPPPLRQKNPGLSEDVELVVMMALAKDPKQRFQSMQAFARAFEQACESSVREDFISTTPISAPPFNLYPTPGYSPPVNRYVEEMGMPIVGASYPPSANHPAQEATMQTSGGEVPIPLHAAQQQLKVSRRFVLMGLAGLGALAITGVGAAAAEWWMRTPLSPTLTPTRSPIVYRTGTASPKFTATTGPASPTPIPTATATPTAAPTATPTNAPTPTNTPVAGQGTVYETYQGHSGMVFADVWSPDGKRVASCGQDGSVQVWDAKTGNNSFAYRGHSNKVYAVSWASNGQFIASGSKDTTVQVWGATNGSAQYLFTGHSLPVYTVNFSPNVQRIASGGVGKTVLVWDALSGSNLLKYTNHTGIIRGVAWSPDGSRIASASDDGTAHIWYAASGSEIAICRGHTDAVYLVAWSPDGSKVASASKDTTVRVWDAASGTSLYVYRGHNKPVWTVDWSSQGQSLASGGEDSTVQIWNTTSLSASYTYRGHNAQVWLALWSADGQNIASCSSDGTVQVWQAV